MYGWDSYFILCAGLFARGGAFELARGMVDNFFFSKFEHYGAMLNANRTYYLTRSQPSFLSSMFCWSVYEAMQKKKVMPSPRGFHEPIRIWRKITRCGPRENPPTSPRKTGLSRVLRFSGSGGPARGKAVQDGNGFYRKVAGYFFFHPASWLTTTS